MFWLIGFIMGVWVIGLVVMMVGFIGVRVGCSLLDVIIMFIIFG